MAALLVLLRVCSLPLLGLLCLSSAASADVVSPQDPHLALFQVSPSRAFSLFLSRFNRTYSTPVERARRFRLFRTNLATALRRQALDPGAVHGVTPFSDLSPREFRSLLGLHAPAVLAQAAQGRVAPRLPVDALPKEWDWRSKGAVTPVKNQGMCGSCYAFSAVGAVEGAHFLKTGKLVSLSEQQIVDCDHQCDPKIPGACDAGCNGGLMNNVLTYVEKVGGLQTEGDYPYEGRKRTCRFDVNKVAVTVQKFVEVPTDENQILASLVKYGPLAVAINAGWMQSYVRGVSCPLFCDRRGLNHGVLLVGYGKHGFSPSRLKYKDFLIIKNSWGESWGEQGYYRVCAGKDECGVDSEVSAVVAVDGDEEGGEGAVGTGAAVAGSSVFSDAQSLLGNVVAGGLHAVGAA